MSKLNKNSNKLSTFFKQVNELNFNSSKGLRKIQCLLNSIYDELNTLKNKQNLTIQGTSIKANLYAKLEAEKEILISLLFVLQEKSIAYILKIN